MCRGKLCPSMSKLRFKSIIIGTGPCGVLTAGLFAGVHGKSTLWVGDSQGVDAIGGRFNQYASVPGNTPVSSFEEAFRMVPLLAEHTPKLSADADGTCPLGHVFPTLVDFSERIAQTCSTSFGTSACVHKTRMKTLAVNGSVAGFTNHLAILLQRESATNTML